MATYGKFVPIECCALRITGLHTDGSAPASSPYAVLELIGKLTIKPVYETGNEFNPKTACGALAITYKDRDILKRCELDLEVQSSPPEFESILTGASLVTDSVPKTIGRQAVQTGVAPPGNGVCVEAWSKNIIAYTGAQDPNHPWKRWVLGKAFWQDGDKNLDGSPFNNIFSGYTTENPSIGTGPFGDWPTALNRSWMDFDDVQGNFPVLTSNDQQLTP